MLFETLLQGKIFLCTLYFGLVCGISLTAKNVVDKMFKQNKIIVIATDIVFFAIATILFLICINLFNFGEFRLYELIGFALGVWLEQISLNKIVEKIFNMIYNVFVKLIKKLKQIKLFAKVLK